MINEYFFRADNSGNHGYVYEHNDRCRDVMTMTIACRVIKKDNTGTKNNHIRASCCSCHIAVAGEN